MRSLLFLSSLLLLSACSDSNDQTASNQSHERQIAQKDSTQTTAISPKPITQVKKSSPSGHSLYAHKCASCHGLTAQKMALNRSQVIAGWDETKITEILKGYQNGTYGSSMKGIMQGQVSTLDDKEIELLSLYISTL